MNKISKKAIIGQNVKIGTFTIIEDGAQIGDNTVIGDMCTIRKNAVIGENCKLTAYCEVRENVNIGNNTTFGSRCTLAANTQIGNNVTIKYGFVSTTLDFKKQVDLEAGSVGDGAIVGANVILMPGASIAQNAMIGACSQLRDTAGENEIWLGNPAKFYKMRNEL